MGQYDGVSDGELIRRSRKGEEGISDYLMEKYKELVRQRARAMFLIGGDTDDLIQEGMIGLFKAIRDYQPDKEASFQTFARLCIERQIYNAVKNSNRQKHMPLNSYISLSREDEDGQLDGLHMENPEAIIIEQESILALEREISRSLSPMENRVLENYLKGNSYIQIARIMGKTPKSIDNAMRRIREKIRSRLEDRQKEGRLSLPSLTQKTEKNGKNEKIRK